MLITWKEIENNDGSSVKNITIRYRIIDDRISRNDWNVLQVNPFKVKQFVVRSLSFFDTINKLLNKFI